MFPAAKVMTVSRSNQAGHAKRERVGQGSLVYEEAEPLILELDSTRLHYRLRQHEVIGNMWVVTGCFVVGEGDKAGPFCHWQDACLYVATLMDKTEALCDKCTEDSVLAYLEKVEESLRGGVIGEVRKRADPRTWMEALR
ncbi:unnamed protein product [Prorocentrum cordatum]|uniref:Uncharacterized protein n=1 Tax=Prorocentrum cordatum TaxID=2364126 RepID=A0ABN9Y280_9DINO|nr:unnamed protein product [Polarella glacialis]